MLAKREPPKFNRLPLVVALLGCLYGPTAWAQSAAAAEEDEDEAKSTATQLDRVEVTGSLLRRLEYDTTSPVQVITADTSASLGQFDTAEFLQKSNVAAGSTQITNQFAAFVIEGGTGVQTLSLRGLGAQRTLVLLDGRRPGPAGTRGQVGAFDLNVIPSSILQRAEVLKDGSSSIYGSDALAGVVNLITRKSFDRPILTVDTRIPFESGGEVYSASAANGWNFNNGDIVVAAEWWQHQELTVGDRDFFGCQEDLFFDQDGRRIDREDRSITRGTPLSGCSNLYADTVIDLLTGLRYIPAPDGVTVGLIPGYRPRGNRSYAQAPQAFYEDVLNFDFYGSTDIINQQERASLYGASDFTFENFSWYTKWLYNNRTTESRRYRQFFPQVGGATAPLSIWRYPNSPNFVARVPSGFALPVMPFRSDQDIEVDYYYVATGVEGTLPTEKYWSWRIDGSYSRSDGDYSSLGIVASRSGDVRFDRTAPVLDYFNPGFLNGTRMNELQAQIGQWHTGNTIYDQWVVTGLLSGDLFELPGGTVGAAFGIEYRDFSIDDQPSDLSVNGDLWGQSSAQVTKGDDSVKEAFAELEVPLITGKPGFESLSLNASGRVFEYDTVDGSDEVWKLGLSWQMVPSLRLRATKGTSYRAPGLFELFLGNQTGFLSQLAIDPCINWGESNNEFVRRNCASLGIPSNFGPGGSSATITSGGGAGVLKPETSRAFTTGLVFTPTFADISVALDYFEFEVQDQISQLGSGAILGGCYGAPVFPNAFCDLFQRNAGNHPTDPFRITTVRDSYLNVNKQEVKGYDLLVRYDGDFSFGKLEIEGQATYVFEDFEQLFEPTQASGFNTDERNGDIGRPKLVGNIRAALERGDWTYTVFMDYIHGTKDIEFTPVTTYFGRPNSIRDIQAERRYYHGAAVRYAQENWNLLVGVRNLFDREPPFISDGLASRYGNVPVISTQYDYYGRTGYVRFNYQF